MVNCRNILLLLGGPFVDCFNMKKCKTFFVFVLAFIFFENAFSQKPPSILPEVALKVAMERFEPRDGEYISGFSVTLKSGAELNKYLRAPAEYYYSAERLYWSVQLNVSTEKGRSGYAVGLSVDAETGKPWR